jgi:hypothetical protein
MGNQRSQEPRLSYAAIGTWILHSKVFINFLDSLIHEPSDRPVVLLPKYVHEQQPQTQRQEI